MTWLVNELSQLSRAYRVYLADKEPLYHEPYNRELPDDDTLARITLAKERLYDTCKNTSLYKYRWPIYASVAALFIEALSLSIYAYQSCQEDDDTCEAPYTRKEVTTQVSAVVTGFFALSAVSLLTARCYLRRKPLSRLHDVIGV